MCSSAGASCACVLGVAAVCFFLNRKGAGSTLAERAMTLGFLSLLR
jgi:hypothetical protein